MRYFFHIYDGSELHPDDVGNDLPDLESAKRMPQVVADELKKSGQFSQSSLVIVTDAKDAILSEYGGESSDND